MRTSSICIFNEDMNDEIRLAFGSPMYGATIYSFLSAIIFDLFSSFMFGKERWVLYAIFTI